MTVPITNDLDLFHIPSCAVVCLQCLKYPLVKETIVFLGVSGILNIVNPNVEGNTRIWIHIRIRVALRPDLL